jgi:RNA polymerase sigma-70 factor (ECF subfamily)
MPFQANIERLYDEHSQALFSFLLNLTRNEADTQDLLQRVFIRIAQNPSLLDGILQPRAFLLRLAHNLAVDLFRRHGTEQKYFSEFASERAHVFEETPEVDERIFRENVELALDELPAEQRGVIHLKLREGLTFEQIAEVLGISSNTAASRYRYGLDKLRTRLRPLYEEIK